VSEIKKQLVKFAVWCLKEGPFDEARSELDSIDMLKKAMELGIVEKTKYDPTIHGESDGADPGDDWYVPVFDVVSLMKSV